MLLKETCLKQFNFNEPVLNVFTSDKSNRLAEPGREEASSDHLYESSKSTKANSREMRCAQTVSCQCGVSYLHP